MIIIVIGKSLYEKTDIIHHAFFNFIISGI